MIAMWANADPSSRSQEVSRLCGQVFVPLIRLEALVEQLQCTHEVQQAFHKYLASRRRQLINKCGDAAVMHSGNTDQPLSAGDAHLLVAGGHDVAWQSLR